MPFDKNKQLDCCTIDGEKIIHLRKEKKISQTELANKIGTYQKVISRIEAGFIKSPSYWLICKISTLLKVPIEELRKPQAGEISGSDGDLV